MIRLHFMAAAAALLAAFASACDDDVETEPSNDGGNGGSGNSSGNASANGGAAGNPTPPDSCTMPGDVGNDLGVGTYCTPGGGECEGFPEANLCLADAGQDQWFCSQIFCDEMTNCGEDAGCQLEAQGSACVPCHCSSEAVGCQ